MLEKVDTKLHSVSEFYRLVLTSKLKLEIMSSSLSAAKSSKFFLQKFFFWLLTSVGIFWLCNFIEDDTILECLLIKEKNTTHRNSTDFLWHTITWRKINISSPLTVYSHILSWMGAFKTWLSFKHELWFKNVLSSVCF